MGDDDRKLRGVLTEHNGRELNDLANFVKDRATGRKEPVTPARRTGASIFSSAKSSKIIARPVIRTKASPEGTLWSQHVSELELAAISPAERQRQEAIFELIRTEQSFCEVLSDISRVYVQPIQKTRVLTAIECDLLFANLSEVSTLHSAFMASLSERQAAQSPVIETIGDLLTDFVRKCEIYAVYTSNQHRMNAEVARLQSTNHRAFATFTASLSGAPDNAHLRLNIREDLTAPTSRLFQYKQTLQSIVSKTPADHADYAACAAAVDEMGKLLQRINEETRAQQNWDRIRMLQQAIDFGTQHVALARNTSTRITRQSDVAHVSIKEMKIKSRREFTLAIVGETVLLIEAADGHAACNGITPSALAAAAAAVASGAKPYKLFRPLAHIADVSAMDIPDMEFGRHMFELRISKPQDLLIVQASTEDDKRAWLAILGARKSVAAPRQHLHVPGDSGAAARSTSASSVDSKVSRSTSAASSASGVNASTGPIEEAAPPPAVDLTDAQMGLSRGEVNVARMTVLVKVLRDGAWDRFGKGDILVAHTSASGNTRLIFMRDEDTGRVYSGAAINTWLVPALRCERAGDRGLTIMLVLEPGVVSTFHILARTPTLADELFAAIDKWRFPHGEKVEPKPAVAEVEQKEEETQEEESEAEAEESEADSDSDSDSADEEEEEPETPLDAPVASAETPAKEEEDTRDAELAELRAEVSMLRLALADSKTEIADILGKREYEQRTLRRLIEKHEAAALKWEEEAAALRAELAAERACGAISLNL